MVTGRSPARAKLVLSDDRAKKALMPRLSPEFKAGIPVAGAVSSRARAKRTGLALIAVLIWFGKMNTKSVVTFETEKPFKANIVKKTVATGKVIPLEEVEIKPQISGIIDEIFLEEGDVVQKGDLIATVRVVPNEQSLINANVDQDDIVNVLDVVTLVNMILES